MNSPFATAGGITIDFADVATAAKMGDDHGLLQELILRRMGAARARREGIVVADDEVSQAFADFCGARELFSQPLVDGWLGRRKLNAGAVRSALAESLIVQKLKEHLAPDPAVRQRFTASPYDFAKAQVQIISFGNAGAAAETLLQLRECESTWEQAVGQAGEMQAIVLRRCNSPLDCAALFVAAPGDYLGPVETDEGNFNVYRVIRTIEPALDEALIDELREEIYRSILMTGLASEPLEYLG